MDGMGLTINDLSLHGHGRDMVMAGWQHNSRSVFFPLVLCMLIRTVNIVVINMVQPFFFLGWKICTSGPKSDRNSSSKRTNCKTSGKNAETNFCTP
jgi:hypothetical protein